MSRSIYNPVRGTIWLPADVADLNEIDWAPEPARRRAEMPAVAPEMVEAA